MMSEFINIDSVNLSFGRHKILEYLYFEFERNKVTGILGRNGTGKSCLLKIITGQISPQSKHIRYKDKYLKHLYQEKGLINYLPQHPFHPSSLSLKKLLQYYEIPEEPFFQRYPFLTEYLSTKFSRISGGERRLIEVLLVLESHAIFSILDEPFSYVMPIHVELIKERIQALAVRKGILLTDHRYKEVMEVSDKIFLLGEGKVREIGNIQDLKNYGYIG